MPERIIDAIVNMREQEALHIVKEMIAAHEDPLAILGASSKALEIVGKRFEEGNYFLPQLIMGAEIFRQISEIIQPELKGEVNPEKWGKVLIGTVQGDLHDIGKDIVVFMLDVNGFDVMDLGIDVPPEKFLHAIQEFQPQVVGLSGFLSLAFDSMKETVDAIRAANVGRDLKIMIGGGQIDDEIRRYTGADAYGLDAMDAVQLSKGWAGGKKP
ncbi:MAG: cobalamin-dependent protein [Thermodesulfobacteriota bacterium]|nr:cobalamin-dependent protein [Thermodesulfobacteriota bacterium]